MQILVEACRYNYNFYLSYETLLLYIYDFYYTAMLATQNFISLSEPIRDFNHIGNTIGLFVVCLFPQLSNSA